MDDFRRFDYADPRHGGEAKRRYKDGSLISKRHEYFQRECLFFAVPQAADPKLPQAALDLSTYIIVPQIHQNVQRLAGAEPLVPNSAPVS